MPLISVSQLINSYILQPIQYQTIFEMHQPLPDIVRGVVNSTAVGEGSSPPAGAAQQHEGITFLETTEIKDDKSKSRRFLLISKNDFFKHHPRIQKYFTFS